MGVVHGAISDCKFCLNSVLLMLVFATRFTRGVHLLFSICEVNMYQNQLNLKLFLFLKVNTYCDLQCDNVVGIYMQSNKVHKVF